MASVTYGKCNVWQVLLMASVTYGKRNYGKCNLWQVWLMASVTYGKSIMAQMKMKNWNEIKNCTTSSCWLNVEPI